MRRVLLLLLLAGCQRAVDAGAAPSNGVSDDDPLTVDAPAQAGSLDQLYREVVYPSCASQPGACHAGQFEPNLSTPALLYANLVLRPGLEHEDELRVRPGDPDHSLVIDKLRNRNVATQMPLGAKPLSEEKIALFERWIRDGALRRPDAPPAPRLNNPPERPEVGVFDGPSTGSQRLDASGAVTVAAGATIVLRHTVKDFETPDDQMAYAGFIVYTADGRQVLFSSDPQYGSFAQAQYDAHAPMGKRRAFSYRYAWTVPVMLTVQDSAGTITQAPSAGLSLTVVAYYADQPDSDGISAYQVVRDLVKVK